MPESPMPVLFAEGRSTAHLMEFRGRALLPYEAPRSAATSGPWRSRCGYGMRREYDRLFDAARGERPRKPWCSLCMRVVRREVAGLAAAGLLAVVSSASVLRATVPEGGQDAG